MGFEGVSVSLVASGFAFFVPEGKSGGGLRGVGTLMNEVSLWSDSIIQNDELFDNRIAAVICVLRISALFPGLSFARREDPTRSNRGGV